VRMIGFLIGGGEVRVRETLELQMLQCCVCCCPAPLVESVDCRGLGKGGRDDARRDPNIGCCYPSL